MPLTWLFRRGQRRRGSAARRRTNNAPLFVRRLERRRVLDASTQALAIPAIVAESDIVTSATPETEISALSFDWAVKQGSNTAPTDSGTSANLTAPNDSYNVDLELVDSIGNVPPVLVVANDQSVNEGQELDLSGIAAPPLGLFIDDSQVNTHSATIDWGDGSALEDATIFFANGSGALGGKHTYADNGAYAVVVTVSDGAGGSDTDSFDVAVNNVGPSATLSHDGPVNEGSSATVSFISTSDPSSADTAAGFRYAYDFDNDGVFDVGDGTYAGSVSDTIQTVPASLLDDSADVHQVRARIIDKDGGFTEETIEIDVLNVSPTATLSNNGPVNEGSAANVLFSGAMDPSAADSVAGFRYAYDFNSDGIFEVGDGAYAGSVTSSSQSVPASFLPDDSNAHTITARIIDKDGGFTDVMTDIMILNVDPTLSKIVGDTIDEGDEANIAATIDDASPIDVFEVTVNWQDGTSDTISGLGATDASGMEGGTKYVWTAATRRLELAHRYVDDGPNPGGGDPNELYVVSLSVRDDDLGTSGPYTAEVIVDNVRPVLVVANHQMVNEGQLLDLSGVAAPPLGLYIDDGVLDTHTATINWGDGSAAESATIFPGSGAGALGGTHTFKDDGVYTVTVTVTDDDGGTDTEEFLVTVQNVRPVLVVANDQMVNEGQLLDLSGIGAPPLGLFIDDGVLDTHTATINWGDGSAVEGATIFPGSGSGALGGTHTYKDDGVYTVIVTVTDDDGGSDTEQFLVTVENVRPVLVVADDRMINEGQLLDLSAIGAPPLGLFIDDGVLDTHTAIVDWGDGAMSESPMIFAANGSGALGGSHTYADDGVYTVTVTVNDDDGGSDTKQFFVTVKNVAPTLSVVDTQTVDEGQLLSITDLGVITDPGFNNPDNPNEAPAGSVEAFAFWISWGDGTVESTGAATIDDIGGVMDLTNASFNGEHTYADNGTYSVTVRVADDDMSSNFAEGVAGVDFVEMTFMVTVHNVDPIIPGENLQVDEGQPFVLTSDMDGGTLDLGVRLTDPGFDNPLNMGNVSNGGEFEETFTSMTVVWGDGSAPEAISIVDRVSGMPGVLTTAGFSHAAHTYADNGVYSVEISVQDDDGPVVTRMLTITVNNVVPTVIPIANQVVDESQTFALPNIGMITDPGFDNPARPGGASFETFTFSINWDDGTSTDTGAATIDDIGGVMDLTDASFDGTHTYADNGTYTVRLRVADDDMSGNFADGVIGVDFVEMTFTVTVNNIAPQFQPFDGVPFQPGEKMIEGDDLTATGLTQVRVAFSDPGFDNPLNAGNLSNGGETAETFTYIVNWGDGTIDTIDVVFVAPGTPLVVNSQTNVLTSARNPGNATTLTTGAFEVQHRYLGPPNPQNPTAPITITLTVMDDDGGTITESIEVRNPGIDTTNVAIDTTPDVPRLELSPPVAGDSLLDQQNSSTQSLQTPDVRLAGGEVAATSERYLELRVVHPDGTESEGIPLEDDVLLDLRRLFAKLPDGRYKIYLIRTDNNTERLVIEVVVRNGRVIEPTDDSEGTRDRPPTSEEAVIESPPADESSQLEEVPMEPSGDAMQTPSDTPVADAGRQIPEAGVTGHSFAPMTHSDGKLSDDGYPWRSVLPLAALGFAATGGWSKRVDGLLEQADERSWQRLRRAARSRRRSPSAKQNLFSRSKYRC